MDGELAELNRKLGSTIVAYGGADAYQMLRSKQALAENAPAAVAADRLAFNSRFGIAVHGDAELLNGLSSGRLKLESLKKDELPPELQKLDKAELKAEIEKKQKDRSELQTRIQKLSQEREAFLKAERKRLPAQGKNDSFDEKVASAIRAQAARKAIDYRD